MALEKYTATITRNEVIKEDTIQIDFLLDEGQKDFLHKGGQHIMLAIHQEITDGRNNVRPFSIYSSPRESKEDKKISVVFRLPENASDYKKYLAKCAPGEKVTIMGPIGNFTLDTTRKITLIAGGTGIVPFRSMIKDVIENNTNIDLTLIYTDKSEKRMIGLEELKDLASKHMNFHLIHRFKRVDQKYLGEQIEDKGAHFMICGTPTMVQDVDSMLQEIGIKKENISFEKFTGY